MKTEKFLLIVSLLATSSMAFAGDDYVCDNNGVKRIIKIAYQSDQQPVPCEVIYDKGQGEQTLWSAQSEVGFCYDKGQGEQTLWSAQSEVGFCEAKADEFQALSTTRVMGLVL